MQPLIDSARSLARALPLACLTLSGCATTQLETNPQVRLYPLQSDSVAAVADRSPETLRVMTLNIAHGRGEGLHQLLQDAAITRDNLDRIATLLRDSRAHVVALQEADDPSFWSGNFSHLDYLARQGGYRQSVHGAHATGLGLSYGTALVSRLALKDPQAITFDPSASPTPKGFVISTVSWPGRPDIAVDVISLHLDFASWTTRRAQAEELIKVLEDRQRPLIVTGDFNNHWQNDSVVQYLCQALDLQAYQPEAPGLATFPRLGRRLDWILVSPGIAFQSYAVLPQPVSDHRAVFAELVLQPPVELRLARAQ